MPDKALIYARSATGRNLARQEDKCRRWCDENGIEVVRVRCETGSMTALELAHNELDGEVDFNILIAEDSARYDRHGDRLISLLDQATERAVRVFTIDGTELTSPEGRWKFRMLTERDAYEKRIAEDRANRAAEEADSPE
ncbi:recombinase family protein [Streptomyces sp. PA5.6]|uniref:recombinase family protein n=1 Tax=Streptomyces sp. PA5.6 TaxID=3035651 RepID=UPI0039046E3C